MLKSPKSLPVQGSKAGQPVAVQPENAEIEWIRPEKIDLKRDPMQFGGGVMNRTQQVVQQNEVAVTGIIDGAQPMAIIEGGEILEVGDIIAGLTVKKITSEFVEFETADGEKLVCQVGK